MSLSLLLVVAVVVVVAVMLQTDVVPGVLVVVDGHNHLLAFLG